MVPKESAEGQVLDRATPPRPKPPKATWYLRCGSCRYLTVAGWGTVPIGTGEPLDEIEEWRVLQPAGAVPIKRAKAKMACQFCGTSFPLFGKEGAHCLVAPPFLARKSTPIPWSGRR